MLYIFSLSDFEYTDFIKGSNFGDGIRVFQVIAFPEIRVTVLFLAEHPSCLVF